MQNYFTRFLIHSSPFDKGNAYNLISFFYLSEIALYGEIMASFRCHGVYGHGTTRYVVFI